MKELIADLREVAAYHDRVADMTHGELMVLSHHYASVARQAADALERQQWVSVSDDSKPFPNLGIGDKVREIDHNVEVADVREVQRVREGYDSLAVCRATQGRE